MFEPIKNTINFNYFEYDDAGNTVAHVSRSLYGEKTEYLPEVLCAFRAFLQGMTFTYVDDVLAVTPSGETSADD